MSRKDNLKKRIDALCNELGLDKVPYDDRTTEAQLNVMIDELEASLPDGPDEGGSDDETNPGETDAETQDDDADDSAGDEIDESEIDDRPVVLVGVGELPPDETLTEDGEAPEVLTNDQGFVQVQALKAFQAKVDGHITLIKSGDTPYLDEDTAMEAVEAHLACFMARL